MFLACCVVIAEAFLFQKAAPTPALPDIMMDYRFTAKPAPKSFPSVKMEPKKLALSNNNLKPVTQSPSRVIEPSKTIKVSPYPVSLVSCSYLISYQLHTEERGGEHVCRLQMVGELSYALPHGVSLAESSHR